MTQGHRLDEIRSIPAPAGEPRTRCPLSSCIWVYPRACGGTHDNSSITVMWTGLSPRLRGNRLATATAALLRRSIPAPAGEPQVRRTRQIPGQVYPRACGGTDWAGRTMVPGAGLSPRLRGNRLRITLRSCPAGVYPRACGGTPRPGRLWPGLGKGLAGPRGSQSRGGAPPGADGGSAEGPAWIFPVSELCLVRAVSPVRLPRPGGCQPAGARRRRQPPGPGRARSV